jgi:hypothetical protein
MKNYPKIPVFLCNFIWSIRILCRDKEHKEGLKIKPEIPITEMPNDTNQQDGCMATRLPVSLALT